MGAWRSRAALHGRAHERVIIGLWIVVTLLLLYAALRWGHFGADAPTDQHFPGSD